MVIKKYLTIWKITLTTVIVGLFFCNNYAVTHAQNQNEIPVITNGSISSNTLIYQNSTLGISLEYPSNWTKMELWGNETLKLYNNQGGIFSVVVDQLSNNTLEEHITKFIENKNKSLSNQISFFPNPFTIIDWDKNYLINNNNASKLIFKFPCMGDLSTCTVLNIWTLSNDRLFLISYLTVPFDLQSDPYFPQVMDMIKSLRINEHTT